MSKKLGPEAGRPIPEMTDAELRRFWSKAALPDPDTGCMNWLAGKFSNGYGKFWLQGANYLAHRISYTLAHGPIPPGMVLDHVVCRNKSCCNPEHMRVCTHRDNSMASDGGTRKMAEAHRAKTRCPKGHAYEGANLYVKPDGRRQCRACKREQERNRYRAKRIAKNITTAA